MLKSQTRNPVQDLNSAARQIRYIPNESFSSTTESDLEAIDVELFAVEDREPGSLDPGQVAASLLSALQQSQLLTFEGEQFLFKRLNFLRFRASAIQAGMDSKRPARKKLKEMSRLLDEAADVREQIVTSNLRLVVSIANRLSISPEEFDDFVAEGNGILLYAIDKFDYARGYRFSTYLTHAVQRHLYRVIDRKRKRAQREFAQERHHLQQEPSVEIDSLEPTQSEIKEAAAAIISKIDETLDEREGFIIRGRFGLNGSGQGSTYSVLGNELGLSKERVRQLYQKAIGKLGEIAKPFESIFAPA